MDIKVSVVIPSLNVNDYILRCLDSIRNQTLKEIEIICIDAGSTDGTREKIIECKEKDNRIKLIDSAVKSYGYQVNVGVKNAKGEYISIVESDDYVTKNMLLHLYEQAKKYKVDVSKGDKIFIYDDKKKEHKHIFSGKEAINYDKKINNGELMNLHISDNNLWNGIYRREFLIKEQLLLNESKGAAFQDIGFLQQVHMLADSMVFSNVPVYYYQMYRDGSSSKSPNRVRYVFQEIKYLEDFIAIKYPDKWSIHRAAVHAKLARCFAEELRIFLINNNWEGEEVDWYDDYLQIKEMIKMWVKNYDIDRKILSKNENEEIYYSVINFKEFSKYIKRTFLRDKEILREIINTVNDKDCIIFGCGQWGRDVIKKLDYYNRKIVAITDNNKKMWHSKIDGVEVLPPNEVIKKWPNGVFVIANKKHTREMKNQLLIMGIAKENILEYNVKWIDGY